MIRMWWATALVLAIAAALAFSFIFTDDIDEEMARAATSRLISAGPP